MIKVSIIVPIYNAEKYLEKCLESLIEQTLENIEIILINDGSKDKSEEIADRYVKQYNGKVKYIYQENSGQAVARNKGIQMATGKYIAFVDSDDYVKKDTYEILVNKAEENGYDILCFNIFENRNGELIYPENRITENEDVLKKYILNEASPCNKLIRRSILSDNKLGFLEGHIYEDFAFIPTLAIYTNKIGYIDDFLYCYNIHDNSTMRQERFNPKLLDIYDVMENLYEKFSKTQYLDELEYLYIEHLLHAASLRFLKYEEGIDEIRHISNIIKEKFPNWKKNKYYRKQSMKYKIVCLLLYYNKPVLVKKLLKIG